MLKRTYHVYTKGAFAYANTIVNKGKEYVYNEVIHIEFVD
jgi:hypothetical protein